MKFLVKAMLALTVFAAFTVSLEAAASPSALGSVAQRFAAAIETLNKKLGPKSENRAIPSDDDPEIAQATIDITEAREAFGTAAFPAKFPDTLNTVCAPLQLLSQRYLLTGTGAANLDSVDRETAGSNAFRHQAVLTPIMSFSYKCVALHLPGLEKFWLGLSPQDRSGSRTETITNIRDSMKRSTVAFTTSSLDTDLTTANRKAMADAIAIGLPYLAAILPIAERKALGLQIEQRAPSFKTVWPEQYRIVTAALSSNTCEAICQI